MIFTGVLGTMGFVSSAAAIGYMYRKAEMIPRVELSHVLAEPVDTGLPRNVLLVGTDSVEDLDADDPIHNERDHGAELADTVMILRVDPSEHRAALLSIPRDLWVTFSETQAQGRINTSLWRGDGRPDVLIDLLNSYLGIPIHHYVQVNFAGFKELIDAVGGVPVYFERPGRDRYSGLHVYETGCVTLNADEALAYARARHYDEYIDGEWEREPRSDLARIERQQDFILRTADRAIDRGARNPGTLDRMLNSALGSVTVDDELTPRDILDLAGRFRSFDPQALETHVLPTEDDTVGAAQIQRLVEHEAEPILELFRDDPEPAVDAVPADGSPNDGFERRPPGQWPDEDRPSEPETAGVEPASEAGPTPPEVRLTVLNGSGQSGQASEAGAQLAEAGFGILGRADASQFGLQRTEIRYPAGLEAEADLVERWLVTGAELVETSEVAGVTLVTGADWEGVRDRPRPSATSSPDGSSEGAWSDVGGTVSAGDSGSAREPESSGRSEGADGSEGDGESEGDGDGDSVDGAEGSDDAGDGASTSTSVTSTSDATTSTTEASERARRC